MSRKIVDAALIAAIRAARSKGRTFRQIASEFGICWSTAQRYAGDIAPGHRTKSIFKHLYNPYIYQPAQGVKRGSKCDAIAGEIRAARQSGLTFREVAKRFDIAVSAAFRVAGDIKMQIHRSQYDPIAPDVLAARARGASYTKLSKQFDIPKTAVFYLIKRREGAARR